MSNDTIATLQIISAILCGIGAAVAVVILFMIVLDAIKGAL